MLLRRFSAEVRISVDSSLEDMKEDSFRYVLSLSFRLFFGLFKSLERKRYNMTISQRMTLIVTPVATKALKIITRL